jgi:hypothetical protein
MADRRLSDHSLFPVSGLVLAMAACSPSDTPRPAPFDASRSSASEATWIAGDHHIHSRFSVGWDTTQSPPAPQVGGDAIYPIPMNATMARRFGLSWMVTTDHGGPNHSRVDLELAYPELVQSREAVPEVIQFYGMELDTPGAEHSSLIIPHTHDEADRLFSLESRFARREPWPPDSTWNTEPRMIEALEYMDGFPDKPVLIANHPSRTAPGLGVYGLLDPSELRGWNDAAPEIAVGMAGAPGHQAIAIARDGTIGRQLPRGAYGRQPTMGGFDQMTARLGGFWDSMLGEGRRWWITANSDSHVNWREGGADFWPGEYSKTYVFAPKTHDDIMAGIRAGRVFVTLGDLVSEVWVTATVGGEHAEIGGELHVGVGQDVEISIRVRDPAGVNHRGESPDVERVDLIVGDVLGPAADRTLDTNPTTRVARRFGPSDWTREGEYLVMTHLIQALDRDIYLRVRGTDGNEDEPEVDPRGEDPWSDLWFYTNPVFLEVVGDG